MKIALILPNNVWFCPYVSIYTEVFKNYGIDYDIISWSRDGSHEDAIQFYYVPKSRSIVAMLYSYRRFASFVKKTIRKNRYDRLVVFTPQSGIFLRAYLKKEFKDRYILDYRDLSIEQKAIFKRPFIDLLQNSFANVISSPGFKEYLPNGFDYILSHNFNVSEVRKAVKDKTIVEINKKPIDILTIGGIRDYDSNVQIIEHLINLGDFTVRFVGKGPSAAALQQKSVELSANNVSFEGYYPKEKEKNYIEESTFLNIYYPRKPSHDAAISNRFYNSLIYRKPMITTKNTTQGDYAEKYNVGVALDNCDNLSNVLREYVTTINAKRFCEDCNGLLQGFLYDYEKWKAMVLKFAETN